MERVKKTIGKLIELQGKALRVPPQDRILFYLFYLSYILDRNFYGMLYSANDKIQVRYTTFSDFALKKRYGKTLYRSFITAFSIEPKHYVAISNIEACTELEPGVPVEN